MSSAVNHVSSTSSDVQLVTAYSSYNISVADVNATSSADAVDHCPWFHFVVNTLLIGALCVFGFFGNTLSLIVLQRDRRNRVAVFLLQSLATADNLVLCMAFIQLSVFFGLLPIVDRRDIQRATAPYLIKYFNPVGYMVQCCVIWITVLLAINRYVAICRPFSATQWLTMRRTRLQVRVTWLNERLHWHI